MYSNYYKHNEATIYGKNNLHDTAVLKKALELRGISIASAWFSSFLTTQPYAQVEKDFIAHCQFLKAMGARFCNVAEQGNSVQGQLGTPVFAGKPQNIVV